MRSNLLMRPKAPASSGQIFVRPFHWAVLTERAANTAAVAAALSTVPFRSSSSSSSPAVSTPAVDGGVDAGPWVEATGPPPMPHSCDGTNVAIACITRCIVNVSAKRGSVYIAASMEYPFHGCAVKVLGDTVTCRTMPSPTGGRAPGINEYFEEARLLTLLNQWYRAEKTQEAAQTTAADTPLSSEPPSLTLPPPFPQHPNILALYGVVPLSHLCACRCTYGKCDLEHEQRRYAAALQYSRKGAAEVGGGPYCLLTEYINGGAWSQFLGYCKASLTPLCILRWFRDVMSALVHVHDHNILHRDIKPSNLYLRIDPEAYTEDADGKTRLLSADGDRLAYYTHLVLGDFDTAKLIRCSSDTRIEDKTVLGTPGFTAPELSIVWGYSPQCAYSCAADLWSTALLFYLILTLGPAAANIGVGAMCIRRKRHSSELGPDFSHGTSSEYIDLNVMTTIANLTVIRGALPTLQGLRSSAAAGASPSSSSRSMGPDDEEEEGDRRTAGVTARETTAKPSESVSVAAGTLAAVMSSCHSTMHSAASGAMTFGKWLAGRHSAPTPGSTRCGKTPEFARCRGTATVTQNATTVANTSDSILSCLPPDQQPSSLRVEDMRNHLHKMWSNMPSGFIELLDAMLRRDPTERPSTDQVFKTIDDLLSQPLHLPAQLPPLTEAVEEEAVTARALQRIRRRRRVVLWAVILHDVNEVVQSEIKDLQRSMEAFALKNAPENSAPGEAVCVKQVRAYAILVNQQFTDAAAYLQQNLLHGSATAADHGGETTSPLNDTRGSTGAIAGEQQPMTLLQYIKQHFYDRVLPQHEIFINIIREVPL